MRYMSRHRELALHLFRGGLGTDPKPGVSLMCHAPPGDCLDGRQLGLDPTHPALRLTLRAFS